MNTEQWQDQGDGNQQRRNRIEDESEGQQH